MRELLIILFVIAVLIVLTAIKYRRQIVGLIGFYKAFKTMRNSMREGGSRPAMRDRSGGIELVKCARCGRWISPSTAVNSLEGLVCSEVDCQTRVS